MTSRAELAAERERFWRSALPAVALPGAMSEVALRAAIDAARSAAYERFDLAHVGRYERSEAPLPAFVEAELVEIVSACAGRSVQRLAHRWARLRQGDYSLVRDDIAWMRGMAPRALDTTVDLSEASTGEAEVVFTHRGQPFFTVPQELGVVALVERGPTTQRYDRYLTHRVGDRVVHRLRVVFAS